MTVDIVIIGGGPAGLSFACSMARTEARVLLIERGTLDNMQTPKPDGREVALTHLSLDILKKLGVWDLIDKSEVSLLKSAQVFDGDSPSLFNVTCDKTMEALGYLVPNYQIRRALYAKVCTAKNIEIRPESTVEDVIQTPDFAQVVLKNGDKISAKLVVAADSRFSNIRRKVGIPTLMQDFSKVMIVSKMRHEKSHHNSALERFDYGQTLALLPMVGDTSSVVLTVKTDESRAILAMSEADFNQKMTRDFKGALGQMTQIGARHSYPLVAAHARTFIAPRFALIGDAAVGMHPVTAHGFNLGLRGQDILANLVADACDKNQDIGAQFLLKTFEKKQIYLTRLMFFGTNGIVALFTNDAPALKPIRRFVLKFAEHFPPIKYLMSQHLTQAKTRQLPKL